MGAGGDPNDTVVVDACAALELLHTFAIVHDDVMDDSERRRGLQTLHVVFEQRHRSHRWAGDGRRFGEGIAVLIGDLAFVYADVLMSAATPAARRVFDELRVEVNLGQYLDVVATARRTADTSQARRICCYKSGRYTIERPLHLGAALAGRLDELAEPLSSYGGPLGIAFQLRDDLLGVFGESCRTGKPVGEDLREGKPTLLYAYAARRAGGPAARLLAERYGDQNLTADDVIRIQQVFEDTGARRRVEAEIQELTTDALAALDTVALVPEISKQLAELALFVASRDY